MLSANKIKFWHPYTSVLVWDASQGVHMEKKMWQTVAAWLLLGASAGMVFLALGGVLPTITSGRVGVLEYRSSSPPSEWQIAAKGEEKEECVWLGDCE
ncbi:MAG TPA: hypothetical protein IGS52_00720 [Oscillatoriaceae cyanobacterium M33_DOE_052]|uniref:Uncharacterized protein n=1 Tax=Planktothricoides sp. SpSt-374 TaxID=2282167 RepID=A0A7C3VMX8_9CYAN|nr:hypothetical protein [Oscillatoriaceae cyanobacterium M33_DOE_052]